MFATVDSRTTRLHGMQSFFAVPLYRFSMRSSRSFAASKRRSTLDRRTTRHPGYAISLSRRWLVEKGFGWLKQTGPIRQVKLRGLHKVDWLFVFSCAAHNLSRLPMLIEQRHPARFRDGCA